MSNKQMTMTISQTKKPASTFANKDFDVEQLKALDESISRIEKIMARIDGQAPKGHTSEERIAFERFMFGLRDTINGVAPKVKVKSNVSWVKIESLVNGHKIYISKGKFTVGRVESTIPVWMLERAMKPSFKNGKIASWIPPDISSVKEAILLLVSTKLDSLEN